MDAPKFGIQNCTFCIATNSYEENNLTKVTYIEQLTVAWLTDWFSEIIQARRLSTTHAKTKANTDISEKLPA